MKRRRALLLSITFVLALCVACGIGLHRERQQYALNRQLITALLYNDTKTALALVNAGADPNTRQASSPAPSLKLLLDYLRYHKQSVVNESPTAFLLACGSNWPVELDTITLHGIRCDEHLPLLQTMLAHGADVNVHTWAAGESALHCAILSRRIRTVEMLLQHGEDTNTQDRWGQTPLLLAARQGEVDIVHALLVHGANPRLQSKIGNYPLHNALSSSHAVALIADLMAHGADPNVKDNSGWTVLQLAQMYERPDVVRLLKQHGAK